jgi:peptidoglycan/LPS O-acetylase OafA/YrhL
LATVKETVDFPGKVPGADRLLRARTLPTGSPSVHLDALRGFAAFSVLLNHWRDAFFVDYQTLPHHNPLVESAYLITGLGHQWVIVFFVMSGYLVGGSVLRAINADRWSWRSYLLARMTRLYIVLLPALALGGALDWAGMHLSGATALYSGNSGMHALTANVHATLTLPVLFGNVLFLQTASLPASLGHAIPTFGSNGPLWSLCNEFWYYIAFPIALLLITRGRSWRTRVLLVAALVAWGWLVGSEIALLGIPWLMGVMISVLPPVPLNGKWTRRLAVAAALAIMGLALVADKLFNSMAGDLTLGVFVTLLICVTLHCATAPLPSGYVRVARRAARSSYTLYLAHLPMLIFLKAFLHLPRALPGAYTCMVALGVMAIALLYAQAVYQLFERNTDLLRQKLKPLVLRNASA